MARRRVRNYNEMEDDAAELLTLFYHYISWRCDPQARAKLQQLLSMLKNLANNEKINRLVREVWRQFEEDAIFCSIPRRQ